VPQQVDIVALWIDEGVTYVDAWFEGNAGYETAGGEGELPPCGEDLQQEVIEELRDADSDDPARDDDNPANENDADAAGGDGEADDPSGSSSADAGSESNKDTAGCSVAGTLTAGPLALGLALLGMARRRRK
jgi:MYXO-CTERM domain-containing protein